MNKHLSLLIFILIGLISACKTAKTTSTSIPKISNKQEDTIPEKYKIPFDIKTNEKLYKACNYWLKTPYKFGGTTKTGVDCSGLTAAIYKEAFGLKLPRTTNDIYNLITPKPIAKLSEGDLVFFNYADKANSHVGIYLGNQKFIHASTSKGVIIGNLNDSYNKKYFSTGGIIYIEAK